MGRVWARLRALDPLVVDGLFAVGVLVPTLVAMAGGTTETNPTPVDALAVGLTLVGVGGIAVRRRWPLPALATCLAVTIVYVVADYPENGLAVATLILLYSAAAQVPRRQWIAAYAAIAAFLVVFSAARPEDLSGGDLVGNLALFGIAAVFGDSNAVRRTTAEAAAARAEALERNQLMEAERAVAEERLRIARELHDVVAHAIGVIAVQSTAGEQVVDTDPETARQVLATINETSRETLDAMRRLLGVLRGEDGTRAELAPAPGLDDLADLAGNLRSAGLDVDVEVAGDPRPLRPGVDLTAYRIAQEALTNVLKHAGPARAAVTVTYGPDAVAVEVSDDGRGAAASPGDGTGHGLLGMRERVALFDGRLQVGPRTGGGWRVLATLPYEPAAP